MKSKSIAALALGLLSCAGNPGVVTITSFSPLNAECGTEDPGTTIKTRGILDIANGQSPNRVEYYTQINLKVNTEALGLTTQSGVVLERPNREQFVLTAFHLTYSIRNGTGALKKLTVTDDYLKTATVDPGGTTMLRLNLIGPKASEALFDEIVPSIGAVKAEDLSELRVGVEAVGHLSGTNVPVNSGIVEFPIEIFQTSSCGAYQNVLFECPFPGQDGTPPKCQ